MTVSRVVRFVRESIMFRDFVPFTLVLWFAVLLAVVWSIETLQQPNPLPAGPTVYYAAGGSFQLTEPASQHTRDMSAR